jgi:hypothetical protein
MHILFIGGSNFVILGGLSHRIPEDLALLSGRAVTRVDNLSVGGTACMAGLHRLLTFADGEGVDFAFIEYGINDLPLHRRNPALWRSAFVALLEATRQRCPGAQIVVVLLGRRDRVHAEPQAALHTDLRRSARAFGARLVEADALLRSSRFDPLPFSAHYADGEHFESPRTVGYLSLLIAAQALLPPANSGAGGTTAPTDAIKEAPLWFRAAELAIHPLWTDCHGGTSQAFSNSRFSLPTRVCSLDADVVIDLPGEPCGLVFASAADSGSLRIEVDGEVSILHTLHKQVEAGRFEFLIRHAPFHWLKAPHTRRAGPRRLRLSLADMQGASAREPVHAAFGMLASSRSLAEQRIFVSSVMSFAPR